MKRVVIFLILFLLTIAGVSSCSRTAIDPWFYKMVALKKDKYVFEINNKDENTPFALVFNNCCTRKQIIFKRGYRVAYTFYNEFHELTLDKIYRDNFILALDCDEDENTVSVELYKYDVEKEELAEDPLYVWKLVDKDQKGNFFNIESWSFRESKENLFHDSFDMKMRKVWHFSKNLSAN